MKVINVTPKYQYIFDDGKVVKEELNKKNGIVTSFLHPKHIFAITKKFDKTINEETKLLEMEKYIYSYPGIDLNKEYKTIFLQVPTVDTIIMEAILVDTQELKNNFSEILKEYKYIDFISPSFLAWEQYYKVTKLEPKNDIFIYFSEDEAFLSAYKDGNYVFHKALTKFSTLAKTLNKSNEEVIEILKTKGLDVSKYENSGEFNVIDKFFSEFFLRVFNIINFSLNEYQIPKFERIIFYSTFEINNLFNQYENYWSINGIELKRSILSTEYDHLEYLITLFNANHYNNESINLSIFSKPPAFFKTKAGKFALFTSLSVLSVVGYGIYEFYMFSKIKNEIDRLQQTYNILTTKNRTYIKIARKYKKENKELLAKIANVENSIDNVIQKLEILYQKAKEPLFFNILSKIAISMKKYSLKAESIEKNNKHITLVIVSNFDNTKEVTYFMQDLIKYNFKNVKVNYIFNQSNNYISTVDFDYE